MKKITLGLVAHVDSGKTTLSEALLYKTGKIRSFGRVDKGESFLDDNSLERKRGITIFSKQAHFDHNNSSFTLLDTPGHVDFSAEMERCLQIMDYALLIISADDGISYRSETLWNMLAEYDIPTFIFFNKMDRQQVDKDILLHDASKILSSGIIDFTVSPYLKNKFENQVNDSKNSLAQDNEFQNSFDQFYDNVAMQSEEAMDEFLENGSVSLDTIADLIAERKIFPAFFGSALKLDGVDDLLDALDVFTLETDYPADFGARVFKILNDNDGNRLTFMKITGGSLKNKESLPDGENDSKINQIRIYSGNKFQSAGEVFAGDICAVSGLKDSYAGMGFGYESETILPLLSPVLSYRVILPKGTDPVGALSQFRMLEEESPELGTEWDEEHKEIYVHVMGDIQLEVLTVMVKERFGLDISFDTGKVIYKETISKPVIGVGHFEPLRHYAEVHILMEPLSQGSGLVFESAVSSDLLAKNWQRLIITHLEEKEHKGVLTGSKITDMKLTVVGGKADKNHTEGGDFRKAAYRAVRQGLMMSESVLLEPYYRFRITVPAENVGRVMTDLDRMHGEFTPPEIIDGTAHFEGKAPVSEFSDYSKELAAFTKGCGSVTALPCGYFPCQNSEKVISEAGYDPLRDLKNTPDSVFCAHGSGYIVPYDEVYSHMHVSFEQDGFLRKSGSESEIVRIKDERNAGEKKISLGTEEIDSIIAGVSRQGDNSSKPGWKKKKRKHSFGIKDGDAKAGINPNSPMLGSSAKKVQIFEPEDADFLLVDGYNMIFASKELSDLASENMDAARISLQEKLSAWKALQSCEVIAVFDAYKVTGHTTEYFDYMNIHIVFTKEAETADQYIERFATEKGKKYKVAVATSDGLEQIIIRGAGCRLISSREFLKKLN